jgi:hypothetical protein
VKRFAAVVGVALFVACTPIEPVPLSNAPINRCSCEAYASQSGVKCNPQTNRCELSSVRPQFPFFVVAHVPDSSYYGAAQTFVLYSGAGAGAPTFNRRSTATAPTSCTNEKCAELGGMTLVTSVYRVEASQSKRVNFPLLDRQLIPARVEYTPLANLRAANAVQPDFPPNLPVETRFATPVLGVEGAETSTALPSGVYRRILYPEPPYDALFPPRTTVVLPDKDVNGNNLLSERLDLKAPPPQQLADFLPVVDEFVLSDSSLDPLASRGVTVQRDAGLEGWQVWVADSTTKKRISTLKTLSGAAQTLTLETSGETQRAPNGGLGDNVEVVVAPPASFVAVPRFINPVNGGDLGTIRYPSIPDPVAVTGRVVEPDIQELLGFKARLAFESRTILTQGEQRDRSPLLHYATTVSTDDLGRFATILPPGTYNVTIDPVEGTGFAKTPQIVEIRGDLTATALVLRPPKRTMVRGRVLLVDERPMAEADILATPRTPASAAVLKPRPNHTRTDREGRFSLDLDQGPYTLTAVPKPGTGFPWVTMAAEVPAADFELSPIHVPAPVPLRFVLRDARRNEDPVPNAVVRIFTSPSDPTAEAVEIGIGTTDVNGEVEILLAPGPP